MNKTLAFIAPLLRGLTFDGEKGGIVAFEDSREAASLARDPAVLKRLESGPLADNVPLSLQPPGDGEEEEAVVRRVRESFSRHLAEHKKAPVVVVCKNEGLFAIGATLDEARGILRYCESLAGKRPAAAPEGGAREDRGANPAAGTAGIVGTARPAVLLPDRNRVVEGKVAVVTGGAQGFGEEIVRHLAAAGSLVFIADINERGAVSLAEELNAAHGLTAAVALDVDVTREESVSAMIEWVLRTAGGIDIFVSNAGVLRAGGVGRQELGEFELVTRVNYTGYFLCAKWASRVMAMQNRPSGRYLTDIIQINSKSGLEGSSRNGAYAGSKFGGIGLTQSFALELAADNVKVNAVCPGNFFDGPLWSDPDNGLFTQYLRTGKVPGAKSVEDVRRFYEEKVPLKRGCTGPDVVRAILYIVEQKYETGQAVPVTGGQVMLG